MSNTVAILDYGANIIIIIETFAEAKIWSLSHKAFGMWALMDLNPQGKEARRNLEDSL